MMTPVPAKPAELALPVASLAALRRALAVEVGEDTAAYALRTAGGAAGDALFRSFAHACGIEEGDEAGVRSALGDLPADVFWARYAAYFARRGWGRLVFQSVHTGIGALEAHDWVEADPQSGSTRPSCFFSTGLLANLLGRVSGDEVAVLEVACRSRGDAHCRFLFGSTATLESLFRSLEAGHDVGESMAALV